MPYDFEVRYNLADVRSLLLYLETQGCTLVSVTRAPRGNQYVIVFGRGADG